MNPIEFVLNLGIFLFVTGLVYGILSRRIFFTQWYYHSDGKKKYWEVVISYLIMIVGLVFIRHLLLIKL